VIKNKIIIFLLLTIVSSCSLDKDSGFWNGATIEKRKKDRAERDANPNNETVFSKKKFFSKEIIGNQTVSLGKIIEKEKWHVSGSNPSNFTGNIEFSGLLKKQTKKKIGKNKFKFFLSNNPPIVYQNSVLSSDNRGTIYSLNDLNQINWKINIYKKIDKKKYKSLSYTYFNNVIYVSDNLGYLYALSANTGKLIWLKNYKIPFRSKIKIFNDKIYLVNNINKLFCFKISDGSILWEHSTVDTRIKSQSFLALSIDKKGKIFFINSAGEITSINSSNGSFFWSFPTLDSIMEHKSDFFQTSDIVIDNETLYFSNMNTNTYSINSKTGFLNWKQNIESSLTPIISGKSLFILSHKGFLVNIDKKTGQLLWSKKIFKDKRNPFSTGIIMGSNKIYATNSEGYISVISATSGDILVQKKIAKSIYSNPIIVNSKLYILTGNSKLLIFE
tara:strand:- start:9552 stop:10883 length:1332 start_codon:yes stop_codon:yes gene_type:complete